LNHPMTIRNYQGGHFNTEEIKKIEGSWGFSNTNCLTSVKKINRITQKKVEKLWIFYVQNHVLVAIFIVKPLQINNK
jgi:hypothetical protein